MSRVNLKALSSMELQIFRNLSQVLLPEIIMERKICFMPFSLNRSKEVLILNIIYSCSTTNVGKLQVK